MIQSTKFLNVCKLTLLHLIIIYVRISVFILQKIVFIFPKKKIKFYFVHIVRFSVFYYRIIIIIIIVIIIVTIEIKIVIIIITREIKIKIIKIIIIMRNSNLGNSNFVRWRDISFFGILHQWRHSIFVLSTFLYFLLL